MKKILGISALVLLMGAGVFARAPYIEYTLELGGNDGAASYKSTGVGPLFQGGTTDDGRTVSGIITWAVRVNAGGLQSVGGVDQLVGGAANLVWDLQLIGPDGKLVGDTGSNNPAFGLGSMTTPGFFSQINDGTDGAGGPDPLEAAAFPWSFNVNGGPNRIFEFGSSGPHMKRIQYPSTYQFPNPSLYPNGRPGVSTAKSGTLMGMGAGYESYNGDIYGSGTERGGVGLDNTYLCSLGANQVVAEGQLNLTGLKGGTYTLALVPGKGNNVVWNSAADCQNIFSGAFAIGVANDANATCPGANLCGDTITFLIDDVCGHVVVNLTPPTAGQWSVDGTNWKNSGDQADICPAGSYTVTFKSTDPCWAAPAAITGTAPKAVITTNAASFTAVGGTLAVAMTKDTSAPAPAGAAWSIDAGATWHTEASLAVLAGAYTVTFKAVDGCITPPNAPVTVACAQTGTAAGNYITACNTPVLMSVASVKTHAQGVGDLPITFWQGGAYVAKQTECRAGGVSSIVMTFDKPIGGTIGAVCQTVAGKNSGTAGTPVVNGSTLTIPITGTANKTSVCVTVSGVQCATGSTPVPTFTVGIVSLFADVNGDGTVNTTDANQCKSASALGKITPAKVRFDINLDGTVNTTDANQAKAASALGTTTLSCQ